MRPGGLTTVLVSRVGADRVAAVDPSTPFVAACRARHPGVDVREAVAEELPYGDDTFEASLASKVAASRATRSRASRRCVAPAGGSRTRPGPLTPRRRISGAATYADVDDLWSSFTGGAGPVGAYARSLAPEVAAHVREECDRLLGHPRPPFTLEASAWCAVGTA